MSLRELCHYTNFLNVALDKPEQTCLAVVKNTKRAINMVADILASRGHEYRILRSKGIVILANKSTLIFKLVSASDVRGLEYQKIFYDEAVNITPEQNAMLQSRIRKQK